MKSIQINKRQGSPDFVLGSFGFKYDEGKEYVNSKGYINFDILQGKDGNSQYIKVSTYGLDSTGALLSPVDDEQIPF